MRNKVRRTILQLSVSTVVLIVAGIAVFTDQVPLVKDPGPPTAEDASAVKNAVSQLREGQLPGTETAQVHLTSRQVAAIGTLASDGFKPDRLLIKMEGDRIEVTGSHKLHHLGRWLNVRLASQGASQGFPSVNLTVGPVRFPAFASRILVEGARLTVNLLGANVPPLNTLVQSSEVKNGELTARVHLPHKSGVFDHFLSGRAARDHENVIRDYCRLTAMQSKEPVEDLARLVRRAFPAEMAGTATPASNRAAFVALAMFTVSPSVGELAGLSSEDVSACIKGPFAIKLHGRNDLSMHWTLSAALEVTTGAQFSQSMGEWKELADSLSKQSQFAEGDPTGFSFLDLAADRSGFLTARAATNAANAKAMAARLAVIGENDILPARLMGLEDGIPEKTFVEKYGSIRDPRFLARVRKLDDALNFTPPD